MLEIGGDSWGWQKWESLWEPIDDDLYLRRGRCSSNTRQLACNNNWMWCQYQTNKHNSNWTSYKQWKKSDLRLFFSPQLQDPKEKWKETSACVSLEQVWDSEMRWARCHMKVALKGEGNHKKIIFEDFLPQWLHLQKQSVPSWWRRVWQQLKQATFLLEKSNYPTLLTPTLKWHFLWKHLKYKSKATIKHKNKLARFFVPYLFSELFFACFPQLWHKCCYFSPTRHFLVLNQNLLKVALVSWNR